MIFEPAGLPHIPEPGGQWMPVTRGRVNRAVLDSRVRRIEKAIGEFDMAAVQPGQWINVKVLKQPRSEAGVKTMVRLFERDSTVTQERKRLTKSRPVKSHRRGGRQWNDRPSRLTVVKTTAGATYRLFGSVDVLRDLNSIASYIEITPA